MTKDEIRNILQPILDQEEDNLDVPTAAEWSNLESKFSTRFNDEFKSFIELMTEFSFPGDILNVQPDGNTNGNDDIASTYDMEMQEGQWKEDLIPFYAIGNGDYFCLSAKEGKNSSVYYLYHEDGRVGKEHDSFAEWVKALPAFLA